MLITRSIQRAHTPDFTTGWTRSPKENLWPGNSEGQQTQIFVGSNAVPDISEESQTRLLD